MFVKTNMKNNRGKCPFKDRSLLIEELKQTLLTAAISFTQQFNTGWRAALRTPSLLLLLGVIPRETHIHPQDGNFWRSPSRTGQDIKCHKPYPLSSPTLLRCPGQSPRHDRPPLHPLQADARDARLVCRTAPLSLLMGSIGAAAPQKSWDSTSQPKSLLSFPSTVPRENACFILPLHFSVFTCLDFF